MDQGVGVLEDVVNKDGVLANSVVGLGREDPVICFGSGVMSSHSWSISFDSADALNRPPCFVGIHLPGTLIS